MFSPFYFNTQGLVSNCIFWPLRHSLQTRLYCVSQLSSSGGFNFQSHLSEGCWVNCSCFSGFVIIESDRVKLQWHSFAQYFLSSCKKQNIWISLSEILAYHDDMLKTKELDELQQSLHEYTITSQGQGYFNHLAFPLHIQFTCLFVLLVFQVGIDKCNCVYPIQLGGIVA